MPPRSIRARRSNLNLSVPQEVPAEAQAIQRGLAQLSNSMDRMSSFFARAYDQRMQIEGAEYGAEIAPTTKQIRDAFQSGEELELPEQGFTTFDRAARKAALSVVQQDVEVLGRTKINSILIDAQDKNRNPTDVAGDINAVIHGFAGSFDDNSPAVSRKLRASLSLWSNSKLATYSEDFLKDTKERRNANFVLGIKESMQAVGSMIRQGLPTGINDLDTGDEIRRPITASDFTALKTAKLREAQALGIKASQLTTIGNMFDKELTTAATTALVDSVLNDENTLAAIKDIRSGKVTKLSQATQNAVSILRGQKKSFSDIAKEVVTRHREVLSYENALQNNLDVRNQTSEGKSIAAIMAAMTTGDKFTVEENLKKLSQTDPVKAEELRAKWVEAGETRTASDPDVLRFLENRRANLSYADVEKAFPSLSLADQAKYYKRAEGYEDEDVKTSLAYVRGELKLPANLDAIDDKDPNFAKVAIYRRVAGRVHLYAMQAKKNNQDFDAVTEADKILKEIGAEVEAASTLLDVRAAKGIILSLNTLGKFKIPSDDFQQALEKLEELRDMKDKDRPANYRGTPVTTLVNQIEALKKVIK